MPGGRADAVLELLVRNARIIDDDPEPPPRSADRDDDYLLALAERHRAVPVSGDVDLLALSDRYPVFGVAAFLDWLDG